jgi:RNA recognition motif-containing protein
MASSRVFVKGLPPSITESQLRKHFSQNGGDITDIKVIPQRRIGFIGYKSTDDAAAAAKYFNRSYIRLSKLAVELAKPVCHSALTYYRTGLTRTGRGSVDFCVQVREQFEVDLSVSGTQAGSRPQVY